MNIHYLVGAQGFEKLTTPQYRARTGERKATKKGTKPPRTRVGKEFPGGKHLRRAHKELARRRKAQQDTIGAMRKGKSINPLAFQEPGSMKGRAR